MLQVICKKLCEEDESFFNFKKEFEPCYASLRCVVDDLKKACEKAKQDLQRNTSQFELISKIDPNIEDLPFGKQTSKFLKDSEPILSKCATLSEKLDSEYEAVCDFYMIGERDEMRKKSEKFFLFFTGFFDDVHKSLPKQEKKDKKPKGARAGQSNLMAELKAKQAQMK
mmetsp:Transcript_30251/g.46272  ORF Transcript_30251/g.46272 Transcript_30251/m.46272 type:complete len:169 (-) Transcript_30251:21-527(-)